MQMGFGLGAASPGVHMARFSLQMIFLSKFARTKSSVCWDQRAGQEHDEISISSSVLAMFNYFEP
jgi:hypothetical protein